MSLNTNTISDVVVNDVLLEDLRNETPLFAIISDSAASRMVLSKVIGGGTAGGFAPHITIPHLSQHALSPVDGYTTETNFATGSYADTDLSSAYPESTDYPIEFYTNKVILGSHYLPDMRKWTHSAGSLLSSAEVRANQAEMRDQMESALIADMKSSTVYAAGSAYTKFTMNTTTEADTNASFKAAFGEFNRQNIPYDMRYMLMPRTAEGTVIKWASLKSKDYVDATSGEAKTARWHEYGGFKLVFSNNCGSTTCLAFSPVKYAAVLPKGIEIEALRTPAKIGTYTRMFGVFGMGSISEIISGADGTSPAQNAQRVGLIDMVLS